MNLLKMWNKVRYWIISMLLTYNEKYLLYHAISTRIMHLDREKITNKSLDVDNIKDDIIELQLIRYKLDIWGN